MQKPRVLIRPD